MLFSPKNHDLCLKRNLNKRYTAIMHQLSIDRFDVEHIAPKGQLRKMIETRIKDGLLISYVNERRIGV